MFDDLKIRNKLILLVAGPLLIIVLLAGLEATARRDAAAGSRRVATLVAVARADSDVVDALQQESLASTDFVASGRQGDATGIEEARATTDAAMSEAVGRLEASRSSSPGFRSASGLAIDSSDKLPYLRQAVDQGYTWNQVATTYAAIEESFLAVNEAVAGSLTDPEVATELRTAASLASYKAALAERSSLLVGAGQDGGFAVEGSFGELRAAVDATTSRQAIFTSVADVDRKGQVRDALTSEAATELERAQDRAMIAGADGGYSTGTVDLTASTGEVLDSLHGVETRLFDNVIARAQDKQAVAERASNLFLVAALVAILAAAGAAVLLGRRITRPLGRLTTAADTLASEHMPRLVESLRNPTEEGLEFEIGALHDIEVTSDDEIGQLARSFNDVQRVAGSVAAEQAALLRKGIGEMFVNLARRNQSLLDRQIEFIDELEREEEDADQLENLYRLDHLATRMRRNAESLLVLAGAEPARRRGRPAPLANVVRAALAEVEDFARIELMSFDEVLIASNAAADLAHLLSELMENAANFSPPETRVEVVGHRTKADGYLISISDHGIGMSQDQLSEANESVARPPLVGLAMSRSLGFIVVGRLARRHEITVRLMPSPAGGVTAVVSLSASLVTDTPTLAPALSDVGPAPQLMAPMDSAPALSSGPAASPPPTPTPAPAPAPAPSSSSSLPPLEFAPLGDAPATLAEAVPSGRAFDDALDELVAQPPTSLFTGATAPTDRSDQAEAPSPRPSSTGPGTTNGLPTRQLRAAPATPRHLEPVEDEPTPEPAPTPASTTPASTTPDQAGPDQQAGPATEVSGTDTLPEALSFPAPPAADAPGVTDLGHAQLDGPPPSVSRLSASAPTPSPAAGTGSVPADRTPSGDDGARPFFLEETGPPAVRDREPAGQVSTTSGAEPTRLFGGPAAPPRRDRPGAESAETTPAPLARRQPAATSSDEASPDASAPAVPSAGGEPVRTATGLAKRVPRRAGATRTIPGADAERGVSATRRSPDEVRNLLSRYRDGQQRARVAEPVPAGASENMENQEMQDHE